MVSRFGPAGSALGTAAAAAFLTDLYRENRSVGVALAARTSIVSVEQKDTQQMSHMEKLARTSATRREMV